ncbi:peptidase S9, prolyl oligopeptidase [Candidatus Koribacter versatilis Ellin345]|uniref:Peptidase S9, prolyl oligopeptidase n=1 Tax=Koribacter versatilis (strain Ellin345) TaxID=204669 RepID=Q1IUF5_KORVE|nr:S9 family peptidase [Candidatus Koribacter versatilis]ABF39495.1 peptidase S9, prolyl oligopeptidase [Candidatus Koribacter versatilis Ellin345]
MRTKFVFLLLIAASFSFAQSHRPITEKDLFRFQWIGDPQLSPDATQVLYVQISVNDKKDNYDTSLWTVATNGQSAPVRLTSGKRDSSPRWSPDGKWIAFIRGSAEPPKEGKPPATQLALLPVKGGEAAIITDLPRSVAQPVWSPDSKHIAFLCDANSDDLAKKQKKDAGAEPEHESDVRVINRAVYRFNGQGYLDPKHHAHIWITDLPTASDAKVTPKQLTTGNFDEQEATFTPDGTRILFHADRNIEPYYTLPVSDILTVPVTGGDVQLINQVKLGGLLGGVSSMVLSPDGKRIAFIGSAPEPVRSYSEPDLWTLELTPGATPKNLTADYDFDVNSGVGGDNRAPRAAGGLDPLWSHDGSTILDVVAKQGRAILVKFDVTGKKQPQEITRGDQAVEQFVASEDSKTVILSVSTPTLLDDLFALQPDGSQRQLTNVNRTLFSELNLTAPEELWYTSFDGKKIQAWIQKPPDFDPKKKYPLILNIHGGPHSAYGWVFDHEFQWMAAKGYVVLYPNPRGSTSYGQDFGNIIQYKYPGDDFKDLMAGVDEVIKRGYIDDSKLGVTGGSGGGLLTDWAVGHTKRFRAAVSQRDISDWAAWWYTADFTLFQPHWFKAPPFDDPQDYIARSPITYIHDIDTPMMFILGEADYRTPPASGGEELFRALRFLHKPALMVRFPGESHELSRSGQPWHRVERLENIVGWFDMYLQGASKPEYRMPSDETSTTPDKEKKP